MNKTAAQPCDPETRESLHGLLERAEAPPAAAEAEERAVIATYSGGLSLAACAARFHRRRRAIAAILDHHCIPRPPIVLPLLMCEIGVAMEVLDMLRSSLETMLRMVASCVAVGQV